MVKTIKYGPSKSFDYGYDDAANALPKASSARMYAGGYSAGRDHLRNSGGKAALLAFQTTKKTIGYATASQRRRMERGVQYS